MVVGMDQYKLIRKKAVEEGLSQREIARQLGISRNTVAKYWKGEHMPWEPARRERRPGIVNEDMEQFIRACLVENTAKLSHPRGVLEPPART